MTSGIQRGASGYPVISPLNPAHDKPIDTSKLWWYGKAWGPLTTQWFEYLHGREEHIWRLLQNTKHLVSFQPVGLKLSPPADWVCDLLCSTGAVNEAEVESTPGMSRAFAFFKHLKKQPEIDMFEALGMNGINFELSKSLVQSTLLSSLQFTEEDWKALNSEEIASVSWGGDISYSMPDDDFISNPSIFDLKCEAQPGSGTTPGTWLLHRITNSKDGTTDLRRLKRFVHNPGVPSYMLLNVYEEAVDIITPELQWMAETTAEIAVAEAESEEQGELSAAAIHHWMDENLSPDDTARLSLCYHLTEILSAVLANPNYTGPRGIIPWLQKWDSYAGVIASPTVSQAEPEVHFFAPKDGILEVRDGGKAGTKEYLRRDAVGSLWWQLFEAEEEDAKDAVRRLMRHHIGLTDLGINPAGKDEEMVLLACMFEAVLSDAKDSLGAEDVPFEWLLATL